MDEKQRRKRRRIGRKKCIIVPLIATLIAVGMTVVVVNNTSILGEMLEKNFNIIENQTQKIGQSTSQGGIVLTVEEAIIDHSSGFIVLSFMKEDGTPFEPGTIAKDLHIQVEKPTSWGASYTPTLSEDGKRLLYLVDMNMRANLYGQKMIATAGSIGKEETNKMPIAIDLKEAYEKAQQTDEPLGLVLTETLPELVLDDITLTHDGELTVYTSYLDQEEKNYLDTHIKMKDTQANVNLHYQGGTNWWESGSNRRIIKDTFSGIRVEDLANLELELEYEKYIPLAEGQWNLPFQLSKNHYVKKVRPNTKITQGEEKVFKIKNVEVSKLGVRIEGRSLKGDIRHLDAFLKMKDGTQLELYRNGESSNLKYFVMHLKPVGEKAKETNGLIDLSQVESILIEGVEIPLS